MRKGVVVLSLLAIISALFLSPTLEAQDPTEAGSVEINGFEMYYETMGQGEPLLLVHGWSGNADYFEPLLGELADHYRLIIPELRGHGRSTNPAGTFTTRQSAADVSALLEHLGLTRVRALGASAGALVLMHMALESPSSMESMILVGSGTHFPPHCKASMAASDADAYGPEWWDVMRSRHTYGDDQIRAIGAMLPELAAAEGDVDFTPERLAAIQPRTFIVHGDSDWCFPPSLAAGMHEAIPESVLWVIPEGAHVPILGEWAPQFLESALGFLKGEGG